MCPSDLLSGLEGHFQLCILTVPMCPDSSLRSEFSPSKWKSQNQKKEGNKAGIHEFQFHQSPCRVRCHTGSREQAASPSSAPAPPQGAWCAAAILHPLPGHDIYPWTCLSPPLTPQEPRPHLTRLYISRPNRGLAHNRPSPCVHSLPL